MCMEATEVHFFCKGIKFDLQIFCELNLIPVGKMSLHGFDPFLGDVDL